MKFNIIYADPPWAYRVWSKATGSGRSAASHYPTLDLESIKALPVQAIAAPDCALFLWATSPNMREAFETIDAWGFTYKTIAFTWIKRNVKAPTLFWGMGYWTRANPEFCLLATRGNPRRVAANVHSVIESPVLRHSAKPPETRDRILQLMGDLPAVELFARPPVPAGWWVPVGNEIDGQDIRDALPLLAYDGAPTQPLLALGDAA